MDKTRTVERKLKCQECENIIEIPEGKQVGDFVECEYCGIEYEITDVTEDGEYELMIVEAEK